MKNSAWGLVVAVAAVAVGLALLAFSALDDGGDGSGDGVGGDDGPTRPATGTPSRPPENVRPSGTIQRGGRAGVPLPAGKGGGPFLHGTAELLHRQEHGDAGAATTSFGAARRGDGELMFGNGGDEFAVRVAPDDRSVIVDLGAGTLADVAAGRVPLLVPPDARERIPAVEGHVYAVRTRDADSDRVSLFRVDSLVPRDRVQITWVDSRRAEGPSAAGANAVGADGSSDDLDRIGERLSEIGERAASEARGSREISGAEAVILQIRTGAQGSAESRVTLGESSGWHRVTEVSERALDVTALPDPDQPSRGWTNRAFIPKDQAFLVEGIDVWAAAPGDAKGKGEVAVRILGTEIFLARDDDRPCSGWWEGRLVVNPGDEPRVILAAANCSSGEVRLHGRLIPQSEAQPMEAVPFWPAVPPDGAARAGGGRGSATRTNILEEPRFSLQIACGGWSDGEVPVTLAGSPREFVKMARAPLSIDTAGREEGVVQAWSPAVRLPRGRTLVVTRVTWRGRAEGDAKGAGGARIVVAGTTLLDSAQTAEALAGEWTGVLRVESGHEAEVLAAVRNRSALDVTFEGSIEIR